MRPPSTHRRLDFHFEPQPWGGGVGSYRGRGQNANENPCYAIGVTPESELEVTTCTGRRMRATEE